MGSEVIRVPMDYDGPIMDLATIYPPEGDGYALWQNTSDVMYSPIFATLRELCDWATENDTSWNGNELTADEWFEELRGWVNE